MYRQRLARNARTAARDRQDLVCCKWGAYHVGLYHRVSIRGFLAISGYHLLTCSDNYISGEAGLVRVDHDAGNMVHSVGLVKADPSEHQQTCSKPLCLSLTISSPKQLSSRVFLICLSLPETPVSLFLDCPTTHQTDHFPWFICSPINDFFLPPLPQTFVSAKLHARM
jgi:hypothetical protein